MIPVVYRSLLRDPATRRLLAGLGISSLGDGMSVVTIAWLAVRVAPAGELGAFVGIALAAYTLPGVIGALAFGRFVRHRPAKSLVLVHCLLRTGFLGAIALLWAWGELTPAAYVPLLAGSSLMAAWGNAGEYTMLSELGGPDGRLAMNSLAGAQVSFAVIVGPAIAGLLIAAVGPGWLIALDAASFAVLGILALSTPTGAATTYGAVDTKAAESGFRLLRRRRDLLSLTALTWVFFFLYGPVEAALPVYIARDLDADAALLGAYWTTFGVGALGRHTHRRHTPRPKHPADHAVDRGRLGGVPGPLRLRPRRHHARVLCRRRVDLRTVHPAHVLPLSIGHRDGEPPRCPCSSQRAGHDLDALGHSARRAPRKQHRRGRNPRRLRSRNPPARRRGNRRMAIRDISLG